MVPKKVLKEFLLKNGKDVSSDAEKHREITVFVLKEPVTINGGTFSNYAGLYPRTLELMTPMLRLEKRFFYGDIAELYDNDGIFWQVNEADNDGTA